MAADDPRVSAAALLTTHGPISTTGPNIPGGSSSTPVTSEPSTHHGLPAVGGGVDREFQQFARRVGRLISSLRARCW